VSDCLLSVLGHEALDLGLGILVFEVGLSRALLGWRRQDVAEAAKVGVATIRRIESQEGPLTGYISTLLKIQAAFEQAGIQFIDEDDAGGFGLRMEKKKRKRSPEP
jgi:transcriptional regulator with XRE-family HTH domain